MSNRYHSAAFGQIIDTHGSENSEQHEAITMAETVRRLNDLEDRACAPKLGRAIEVNVAKIVRAFRPGDIVIVECAREVSDDQIRAMREQLAATLAVCDIEMIFLPPGCKVASREEVESTSSIAP